MQNSFNFITLNTRGKKRFKNHKKTVLILTTKATRKRSFICNIFNSAYLNRIQKMFKYLLYNELMISVLKLIFLVIFKVSLL